jgi:APA family basic amino acid/polyamine antiporter
MEASRPAGNGSAQPRKELSLFDTSAIIVGIIIGSGLYESSPVIAGSVRSIGELVGVWFAGGVFALIGALCYAELATHYPSEGGDYVFLRNAWGRAAGFLFGWLQLWVVRPGSIGAMAYVFGAYAQQLAPVGEQGSTIYACGAIVLLTAINVLGVRPGKWTQDVLTSAKVIGLASIVAVALWVAPHPEAVANAAPSEGNLRLAMILVLFAYGGWNEMAYVAAEVRDPQRNIVRALLGGTIVVVLVYVSVNFALAHTLGLSGMAGSQAVAAEAIARAVGPWGGQAVSLLICISALGSMNGMTFTGSRIYYAMGHDHRLFAPLGRWHPRLQSPVNSLLTEAAITLVMIVSLAAIYGSDRRHFERLVTFTAPFFWLFLLITGGTLIVLRQRRRAGETLGFRVPFYPVTPLVFMAVCGFMTWSSLTYAYQNRSIEAVGSIAALVVGVILAVLDSFTAQTDERE